MQLDTWYDLAVRELGELTDHAKEMLDEAEKAVTVAATPMPGEDEVSAVPPAAAAGCRGGRNSGKMKRAPGCLPGARRCLTAVSR